MIYRYIVAAAFGRVEFSSLLASSFFFLEDDRKRNCRAGQAGRSMHAARPQRTQPSQQKVFPPQEKYFFLSHNHEEGR
jgi:hypothetical protein